MRRGKLNSLEVELASSILYYDLEEMNKFLTIFDAILSEDNIAIDGTFILFVSYIKKWLTDQEEKEEIEDPEDRKNSIVESIRIRNNQRPNSKERDIMSLWMEKVLATNVPMELSEDILYHFIWSEFKSSIERIDASDMSFEDKLAVRPKIPQMLMKDGIIHLRDIEVYEDNYTEKFITGVPDLDRVVRIEKGGFVVIAARPGVGKSLFMLQMAIANAKERKKCLYLSLEMNTNQLDERIVNYCAEQNLREIFTDEHGLLDFNEFQKARKELKERPSFATIDKNLQLYVTTKSNAESIIADIEDQVKQHKYQMVYIDYLQLLRYSNQDEWASIRTLTKELKKLASNLKIVIVTGSQVSRSSTERGLYLTDLFGGSSIEADTDVVIGLEELRERQHGANSVLNIKLMKNRDGDRIESKALTDYSNGRIRRYES